MKAMSIAPAVQISGDSNVKRGGIRRGWKLVSLVSLLLMLLIGVVSRVTMSAETETTKAAQIPASQKKLQSQSQRHYYKEYFDRIANAAKNRTGQVVLVAGRGTSGTSSFVEYLHRNPKHDSFTLIHFKKVYLPDHGCRSAVSHCIKEHQQKAVKAWKVSWKDFKHGEIWLRQLLDDVSAHLAGLLSCGSCGILVLSDTPWTFFFTELYRALNAVSPVKVVLLTRDPKNWAQSRIKNHGFDLLCVRWKANNRANDP